MKRGATGQKLYMKKTHLIDLKGVLHQNKIEF